MRRFEIILMAILLLGAAYVLIAGPGDRAAFASVAVSYVALISALLHLHATREGLRWQMFPLYAAIATVYVALGLSLLIPQSAIAALAGAVVLCAPAALLINWALPMFRLEPPTGPHTVGTRIIHLVDRNRSDKAAVSSVPRELMVQVWYPARPSPKPLATYRRRSETTRVSSYQALLPTNSRVDAPVANSPTVFPVLLFNPAWNGRRTQNTFLTEELASHGFVVAAIDHTYNSEPVAFPDGRVVMAQHMRAIEDVLSSTFGEVQRTGTAEVQKQVEDCRFVLDTLTAWNEEEGSDWYGRLDISNAGVLGHSLGGAVAVECWRTDSRVRAAMNMDGWSFETPIENAPSNEPHQAFANGPPLLFLYEEHHVSDPAIADGGTAKDQMDAWDNRRVSRLIQNHGGYSFQLSGANHLNFTDRPVASPLRRLSGGGPIDPIVAHRIVRAYSLAFFLQALRGKPAAWLAQGTQPYTEIVRVVTRIEQ